MKYIQKFKSYQINESKPVKSKIEYHVDPSYINFTIKDPEYDYYESCWNNDIIYQRECKEFISHPLPHNINGIQNCQ